jgi:periplasmic protein CpxP/Spy
MKCNKLTAIAILALGGVLAINTIATAADETKPAAPAAGKKAEAAPAPTEADIAKLEADLGLSPELTAKIEALQKDQNARRKVMYADASLSKEDKEAKNKAIVDETREKIKALLTPEQFAKWQKLHEARKAFKAANKK